MTSEAVPDVKPRQLDFMCAVMRTAHLEGITREQFLYMANAYFDQVDPLPKEPK